MRCESHPPGSFCTTVLRTRDPQGAATFYNTLGGWTVEPVNGSRQHFLMLFEGQPVAALQDVFDGQDEWVPHVSVTDIDAAVSRALELGATLVDTSAVSGFARLATLRDAEGGRFGMWQPFSSTPSRAQVALVGSSTQGSIVSCAKSRPGEGLI